LTRTEENQENQTAANLAPEATGLQAQGNNKTDASLRFFGWPGLLALCVCLVDQISKWLVVAAWPVGKIIVVIPGFFNLVHVRNPGAAWGIMASHTWFLALLSLLAFVFMVIFFQRLHGGSRLASLSLGAVIGGIVGNMIDRFWRQSVVDFLDFHLGGYHWPAFNVADSAICVGVTLLLLWSLFGGQSTGSEPFGASSET